MNVEEIAPTHTFTATLQHLIDSLGEVCHQVSNTAESVIMKTPLAPLARKINNFLMSYPDIFFLYL